MTYPISKQNDIVDDLMDSLTKEKYEVCSILELPPDDEIKKYTLYVVIQANELIYKCITPDNRIVTDKITRADSYTLSRVKDAADLQNKYTKEDILSLTSERGHTTLAQIREYEMHKLSDALSTNTLLVAARTGEREMVKKLIAFSDLLLKNATSHYDDRHDLTERVTPALREAIRAKNWDIVGEILDGLILANIPNIPFLERYPSHEWLFRDVLMAAVRAKNEVIVERLLINFYDEIITRWDWGKALEVAAGIGYEVMVDKLIAKLLTGADSLGPSLSDWAGQHALRNAAKYGHLDVVNKLIRAGVDVNGPYSQEGFVLAAKGGHLKIMNTLIKAGVVLKGQKKIISLTTFYGINLQEDTGEQALRVAAEAGNWDIVENLISYGVDVTGEAGADTLRVAITSGVQDIGSILKIAGADAERAKFFRYCIVNKPIIKDRHVGVAGQQALECAARLEQWEIVRQYIQFGVYLEGKLGQWVLKAAGEKNWEMVFFLVEIYVEGKEQAAQCALESAAKAGNWSFVKTLLSYDDDDKNNMDVMKGDTSQWVLGYAAREGNWGIVEKLISLGVNMKGWGGKCALESAARKGDWDIVLSLIIRNVDLTGETGQWALESAARKGNWDVISMLIKTGVDVTGWGGRIAFLATLEARNDTLFRDFLKFLVISIKERYSLVWMSKLPEDDQTEKHTLYIVIQDDDLIYKCATYYGEIKTDKITKAELPIISGINDNNDLQNRKQEILKITSSRRHTPVEYVEFIRFLESDEILKALIIENKFLRKFVEELTHFIHPMLEWLYQLPFIKFMKYFDYDNLELKIGLKPFIGMLFSIGQQTEKLFFLIEKINDFNQFVWIAKSCDPACLSAKNNEAKSLDQIAEEQNKPQIARWIQQAVREEATVNTLEEEVRSSVSSMSMFSENIINNNVLNQNEAISDSELDYFSTEETVNLDEEENAYTSHAEELSSLCRIS